MIQVIEHSCSLCGRSEKEVGGELHWAVGVGFVCRDCEKVVPKDVNSKCDACEVTDKI